MLAATTHATARPFAGLARRPYSKSLPIWNIRSRRPICDNTATGVAAGPPKSAADRSGIRWPRSDGPSRRPAMISPTARGWRSAAAAEPAARAARMITTSCSSTATTVVSVWWTDAFILFPPDERAE